jgi:hypothetical protein
MSKQQKSFAKGFASQSAMVTKQTNNHELAKLRRRDRERVLTVVKQRKEIESLKKQQFDEAMLQELNKRRAMVHFGNSQTKRTYFYNLYF